MIGRISPGRSTLSSPAQIGRTDGRRRAILLEVAGSLLSSLEGSRRVMDGFGEDQEKGASAYKRRGAGALRGLYWGKLCPSLICSEAWPRGGGYGGAALRVWRSCCSWRWSLEMGKGVDLSKKKAKRERERAIQIQTSGDSRRSQTQHDIWRQQQQSVEDNLNLEEILTSQLRPSQLPLPLPLAQRPPCLSPVQVTQFPLFPLLPQRRPPSYLSAVPAAQLQSAQLPLAGTAQLSAQLPLTQRRDTAQLPTLVKPTVLTKSDIRTDMILVSLVIASILYFRL